MGKTRSALGRIVHTVWGNLQLRCCNGKLHQYRNKQKCKCYENIRLLFTLEDLNLFCSTNSTSILSLQRPSIDRVDSSKDYSIDNIQFIELSDNIRKEKIKAKDGMCECYRCKITKPLDVFALDNRRISGRSTICKSCDNDRRYRKDLIICTGA